MKKNLHHFPHLTEIQERIASCTPLSRRRWGRMEASQMLEHCARILEIPLKIREIPPVNPLFKMVGVTAKWEMKIFNNGIPPYMPTFRSVVVEESCIFEESKALLFQRLDAYSALAERGELPTKHPLFGNLSADDWGFLEYKHLHHHLKQFSC